ncbi:sensor histidine kinase [Taibaiella koreensis]|uniref:sensor histidine kinase n=1 Tax=Taibaiella koreensis TaxID=1268548 RepID=UPI000E59CFC6|nr:HAMP domain-containing sensor histidine kinase [Taibaiella koreensis]
MKLVNKFTWSFVAIVLILTPVTMSISYRSIKKQLDKAEGERLAEMNNNVAAKLRAGHASQEYTQSHPIAITKVPTLPGQTVQIIETQEFNNALNRKECLLTVNSFYEINGENYKVSSYNFVTKSEQIFRGMMTAVIWKVILLVAGTIVTARVISRFVLSPFRQTMATINGFRVKQKEKIVLPETSTKEFNELNKFLQKMTDKAIEDYASVKEFSENASHELQTPLAVIRSKIELMAETNIDATQAALIEDMQNAIEKLSSINRSLTLLTKLENQEFEASHDIKFCTVTKQVIASLEDWIQMKQLTLTRSLDKDVPLTIHPALAEMLMTNLLSNAIRHNIPGGRIEVELSAKGLVISNTGLPPEIPTEELFQRFKKSNQSADSIGLGLAIVKQICEVNRFAINYEYNDGWHMIGVCFDRNSKMASAAQRFARLQQISVPA